MNNKDHIEKFKPGRINSKWSLTEHIKFLICRTILKNVTDIQLKYSQIAEYVETKNFNEIKIHNDAYEAFAMNKSLRMMIHQSLLNLTPIQEQKVANTNWTAKEMRILEEKLLLLIFLLFYFKKFYLIFYNF